MVVPYREGEWKSPYSEAEGEAKQLEALRIAAKALLEAGENILEVAKRTGTPLEVLCVWFKLEVAQPAKRRPGGGRKTLIDDAGLQILREIVEANGNSWCPPKRRFS